MKSGADQALEQEGEEDEEDEEDILTCAQHHPAYVPGAQPPHTDGCECTVGG